MIYPERLMTYFHWKWESISHFFSLPVTPGPRFPHRAKFFALNKDTGDELLMHEWVFPISQRLASKITSTGHLLETSYKHLSRVAVPSNLLRPRGFTFEMEGRKLNFLTAFLWCPDVEGLFLTNSVYSKSISFHKSIFVGLHSTHLWLCRSILP